MRAATLDALRHGPAVLSIPEAGRYLGLSKASAYRAAKEGRIPTIAVGERRWVVPTMKLAELLGEEEFEVIPP